MKRTLPACCTGHFLVDFACAFLLFSSLRSQPDWAALLIAYNFCAFAVQMPLGLLADQWRRDAWVAAAGAALVALAYGFAEWPWAAAILAGLGNAAFHVGGGLETLSVSGEKAGPLGLFVSPGAVGLYLGTVLGKQGGLPLWLPPLLLIPAALVLLRSGQPRRSAEPLPSVGPAAVPVLLLLAVVVLRSYVGMSLTLPWKGTGQWGLVLVLALAGGKAVGGYLADRFGFIRTAGFSLVLSAVLLLISGIPAFDTLAILLFNMTMPLTLWAAARLLPGGRGFAFGILTFGLFLGFLPVAFEGAGLSGMAAAVWALVSLALLLPGLGKAVGK